MKRRSFLVLVTSVLLVLPRAAAAEENWPQWRGPSANGTANSTNLPTNWSATENVVWKAELPHWSGGTPVIWGDRIFVTSPSKPAVAAAAEPAGQSAATPLPNGQRVDALMQGQPGQGERRGPGRRGPGRGRGGGRDPGGQQLLLLCLSRQDGSLLWQRELDSGNELKMKQNNSSPSPVTDGTYVWAVTGNGVVTALDVSNKIVWRRNLQDDYGDFGLNWGYASSPLLYDGKLILQVLHGMKTDDPSYVVALDSKTGKPVWRVERPTDAVSESPDAYTTPAVVKAGGQTQIVVSGGDYVTGHDPATGREIWRAGGLNPGKQRNYRVVASPTIVGEMIFAPSRKAPLLALRAGGTGDVTESQRAWAFTQNGAPDVPSPVSDGKYFYMVDDSGIASCLDVQTGQRIWGPQRTAPGTVSSSLVMADGKLYIINENAVTTVLAAGPEFKSLATNELDGSYTLSSPAVAGNQLFIRTGTHLYCIGNAAAP
jgi:outer membrane protein assembly factor BamB